MSVDNFYYYGSAENKLNSKGQVAIPARFRSVVPEEDKNRSYVITRGEANCLYMYTHRQFAIIKNNAKRVAEENGDIDFYRRFMAEASAVEIDAQGRFVLPQFFMKAAGIKGPTILFIGMDNRIEIWEPELYAAANAKADDYEGLRRQKARDIFGI